MIPEINEEQINALTQMASGIGAISVVVPSAKLDNYDKYNALAAELCDLNHLVILGFLKDITDSCGDKLAVMYSMSGRLFRIFEITESGRRMFDGVERPIQ